MLNNIKIAAIGGGTGLSTMLRGIKKFTHNISAIVTVSDDGGGSGWLRQDLGMLPPGDIRNCILALAEMEPQMEKLLNYRFNEGQLSGQSFGNLFLAAMNGISSTFEQAVERVSDVLKVKGKVIPVTLADVHLIAEFEDGETVRGESSITEYGKLRRSHISNINLDPPNVIPVRNAVKAIAEADIIVLGPGSLYTSIIPNLLVPGIVQTILASPAPCIYVCNIMTQPGETHSMSAARHIETIRKYSDPNLIDYAVINMQSIPREVLHHYYNEEGSLSVAYDIDEIADMGITPILENLVKIENGYIRHDADQLAKAIISLARSRAAKA